MCQECLEPEAPGPGVFGPAKLIPQCRQLNRHGNGQGRHESALRHLLSPIIMAFRPIESGPMRGSTV